MTVLVTIAAMLAAPGPATEPPVAENRWYLRRHRATRPYRDWLASTRACETRGQPAPYRTNTGNGYFGAYQFDLPTWASVGGRGYPHLAPPLEQDYRAVRLLHLQGAGAWPVCG
jgi:resuscitation-promoting factor RpfA